MDMHEGKSLSKWHLLFCHSKFKQTFDGLHPTIRSKLKKNDLKISR